MDPTMTTSVTGGTSSDTNTTAFNITTGAISADALLVVGTVGQAVQASLRDVSSVTINGVSMTHVARASGDNGGGYGSRTELWYLTGTSIPASGTYSISITYGGTQEGIACGAMLFRGIKPQAANVTATNNANGTNPLSVNITPTRGNTLIVAIYGSQNSADPSAGAGQTEGFDSRPDNDLTCQGSYKIQRAPSATTVSAGFVNPESEEIVAAAYEIIPAGGGFLFNML